MLTKTNRPEAKSNQQIVNELIGRLGLLIDELQFQYCNDETIAKPLANKETKVEENGIPWDDDMPF
jgi:hypothetical protein